MEPITRAYEAQVDDVSVTARTITAIINTAAIDRYKTVIDPAGVDIASYQSNPVVLWEHGKDPTRGRVPIGRNLWINRRGGKLVAKTEFAKDDYSQSLFDLYREGFLRGWSIFALPDPKRASRPTKEELRARPELAECEKIYRACQLGEYSGVSIPGNPETLTILAERSIWFPPEARAVDVPPEAEEPAPTEAEEGTPDDEVPAPAERSALELPEAVRGRTYSEIHAQILLECRSMRTEILGHFRDLSELMRGRV